jgi:hypothetical protein
MRLITAFAPVFESDQFGPIEGQINVRLAPGFSADIAVHAKRYDINGLYAYERYACAPPFSGMADPSSAKLLAPVHAKRPETSQTPRLAPTLFALATTTPGEELWS